MHHLAGGIIYTELTYSIIKLQVLEVNHQYKD